MPTCTSGTGGGSGRMKGTFSAIQKKAQTANERQVLNHVPDEDMGKTYQSLSYSDRSVISGALRITKSDVEFLNEYKGSGNLSNDLRIGGKKYTTIIDVDENNNVVYSLRKGRKKIVEKGTYQNVANQLSMLMKQSR